MALACIAESVASAVIENLLTTCSSYLEACPSAGGMQDDLERLQYALPQVQAVLTAVEEGAPVTPQNKALDTWLWQLRDAVECAEDVLDELEYDELEKAIRDRDGEVRGILSKCKRKFDSFVNCIYSDGTLKRLREAVKGLDRVVAGMGPLLQLVNGLYGPGVKRQKPEEVRNARETSSLLTESEVLGRDEERDLIVEWLIEPGDADVSAFTIVGMGGLGKTTLAQLVYRDERVQEYFDPIMWVCVSQNFDAAAITKKMLEGASSDSLGDKSLNALHYILKQKISSKRFLLMLDDVWNDDKTMEWEKLVAPFKFGQRGSKILLTTRMGSVADMVAKVMQCKRESLNLNGLEESDYMSLFNKHAFLGMNPDDYKNLQPIGKQIAKKLGGCPLAIKVMGGLLNFSMDYDYWKRILKEDIMNLRQGKDCIMTVLRLSYDHLPTNLQVCFRYCSIFPQDYMFKKKTLVDMWMSSGLIPQSICGEQRPEDIGKEYLDLLTRKSFFICQSTDLLYKISKRYVMHNLLHDLAQSVSLGECIRIGGDVVRNTIPRTVRHLSIENIHLLSIKEISNLKNMRTLVLSIEEDHENDANYLLMFNEVVERFKKLRLLSMHVNFNFYKMPNALNSLIHLRYLSLSEGMVTNESLMDFFHPNLCRLYHLQFLKFLTHKISTDVIEYDGLTNLVNLRSLDVPYGVIENIPYVSKLPFICKLKDFFVREKSGYKIGELRKLRDLRHLCIRELENVRSSEEAMEAKLNEKEYLKSLSLQWSSDRSNTAEADEQLLDNLCPHINLKKLCIKDYQGIKSPCWITDLSLINLTSIELIDCKGWEHFPPLQGLPSLNRLYLSGLDLVKQIGCSFYRSGGGCGFPSLRHLFLLDMPNLEEWIEIDDGCMFPHLQTMEIRRCPNLRGLPALPHSLRDLCLFDVGLTALPAINQHCGNNNQQECFQACESLVIEQCEKLEHLPLEFFRKFNILKYLCIEKCPKLTKHGISDIQLPSILNQLTVGSCGDLEASLLWSANLTSLTQLELLDCASITSIPPAQVCARWTMLSHLEIRNCAELSSFGGIQALVSLRSLEIRGCDKLIAVSLRQPPFPNDVGQKNAMDCFLKLGELSIDHHMLLLMDPLRSLSYISRLTLSDNSQLTTLPDKWLLQNHAALKNLSITNACSLQSLPQSMTKLCSLEILEVWNANLIQSLPDLPTSLCTLYIIECHPALKERCQKNTGLDWPKIANIPNVAIY
ncbi:disease resistance protein RGA2-like [Ananas comosus]|uniref:Disease resistance protein RGA2-like n=1 Tax=Ananas comosus TaxID=4615 RepID=A0A6P5FZ62_ANACO|nr:disease resistance protein RGA2-like [Ananas comosus]XP_020098798.1 disease resistance protein RGA2-like [Ananas comosus]XP_020098800.1 disease resistance protein RGA2-like [Ananas comosus]